jgi:hypothetical protein
MGPALTRGGMTQSAQEKRRTRRTRVTLASDGRGPRASLARISHATRISLKPRRKSATHRVLANGARFDELQQVIASAGLRADTRHAEAAEGLTSNECTRDAAIEVEISDAEFAACASQVRGLAAVDAARQLVLWRVCDGERFVEVLRIHHGEDWSEDLLARKTSVGLDAAENRRTNVRLTNFRLEACGHVEREFMLTFGLPDFDVGTNLASSFFVDDGADVGA